MGQGAVRSINSLGKEIFTTRLDLIDEALKDFLDGDLVNMSDLVH